MYVYTDYPYGATIDSADRDAAKQWWGPVETSWIRANVVTDTFGNSIDASGTSQHLTGGADRALLHALREVADVVVVGGATLRAEPKSIPSNRPVVVVSRGASVPDETIAKANAGITVLHHRDAIPPVGVDSVVLSRFTGTSIAAAIRKLGHRRIVVEGGSVLLTTMLATGSISEWCQTFSPNYAGYPNSHGRLNVPGTVTFSAHDAAGFRYTRINPDGAPVSHSD
jgi:riboflavin biosynthesis pyrimidine reductase